MVQGGHCAGGAAAARGATRAISLSSCTAAWVAAGLVVLIGSVVLLA